MENPEKLNLQDEDLNSETRDDESDGTLPWVVSAERPNTVLSDDGVTSGEFVLRTLFAEFTIVAEQKIELVLAEPLERPLSKTLQRGEDPQFDQLLSSLNIVAEYSLLSMLKTLFKWYEKQQNLKFGDEIDNPCKSKSNSRPRSGADSPKLIVKSSKEKDYLSDRRDLAVDFLFCLVLIEILKQLNVHPIDDEYLQYIESLAFRHFKQRDNGSASPSATNSQIIAALYAEVIGVLAMARFPNIRKRFTAEFKEHQNNTNMLINLIYGMKYLRIKLFPVEELEEGFLFLRECATLFIDAKEKDIKFAFASMFVEILLPVAACANRELNVPALKNFVDMMFHHAVDLAKVKRNIQSTYPLVTVLLCVSQKAFFLSNWFNFLSQCLASVRQKDVKIQRIALECLYRLVWVYVMRIKCENNSTTVSRLRSITETLFPRGAKTVVPSPKDVPLNIFVKIIQFIAQEKLDFAMNDIIFDLLGIGRTRQIISPERMNIGLRAFFVIADNLQRKGGEAPPMPSTISTLPSGNTIKVKKITLPKTLTEKAANIIGLANYYHSVRKAVDSILRGLDSQVGKPMIMINPHCSHKEDDMITGERKPKIDLFRTCIAVIPRCIPEGMTKIELVEFLSRLTMHMDEELRGLAFSALQTLVMDLADWREVVILGFVNFIVKDVQDNFLIKDAQDNLLPLLDSGLRMLLQLLAVWKQVLISSDSNNKNGDDETLELSSHNLLCDKELDRIDVLHSVEGCALVMLCNSRPSIRRLGVIVLKEVRTIFQLIDPDGKERKEKIVMEVIEQIFPTVLDKTLSVVAQSEKLFSGQLGNIDIMVMNDRLGTFADQESSDQMLTLCSDLWLNLLAGLLDKNYLPESCQSAIQFSWPAVFNRLLNVYAVIDPGASGMDSITSLSSMYNRGPKKISNMGDIRLWRNYLVFACCTHPKTPPTRSESPDQDGGTFFEGSDKEYSRPPSPNMVDSLFRFAVPLLKSDYSKIRESIISGLGRTSPSSYRDFIEEIHFLVREALDKRAESVRKRRKRDSLRSYLTKVFELNAQYGCFADSESEVVKEDGLISFFEEYIDGIRLYLENEPDKDWPAIMHLRLYFCNFVYKLITSVSKTQQECLLPMDLRRNLFFLFSSWCAHFGVKASGIDKPMLIPSAQSNDLELASLHAMCGILHCGPMFDTNGLSLSGYLYSWLKLVLNSPKEKIHLLGRNTLTRLLENNSNTPTLLHWVIEKCYTGTKLVASGCFRALCSVLTKRTDYPCEMIPLLNVVLFKTADTCIDLREKAAQLLQILERRLFKYTPPSISCSALCSYSQSQIELSTSLAKAHPEITVYMFEEMTSRFQTTASSSQRCILQYMLPWLANIELVDLSSTPSLPNMEVKLDQEKEDLQSEVMLPIEMNGEGWGSVEATRLVLNNLFYITVKYDDYFSKEIESAWASLVCGQWINNVHEILSYLITLAGVVGQSEVLIHAKKLAVYIARAQTNQTVDELMEELKLTETVASQFERSDIPPYFKAVNKTSSSRDSVCEDTKKTALTADKHVKTQEEAGKKEAKEDRKVDSLPRINSIEKGSSAEQSDMAPLAEPEDVEEDNKVEQFEDVYWPHEWVFSVHKIGIAVPLPFPDRQMYYAPLNDVLPFASAAASLYRCNFALMVLTELVLDQPKVEWDRHVPLMLHLIFLGLDHGKALVYEHCKRLLVNLIIIIVCHGNYIHIAQPLCDFMAGSEQTLGKHQLQKSVWTLDIGSIIRVPDNNETSAGTDNQGKAKTASDDGEDSDANASVKFTAGSEPTQEDDSKEGKYESVKSLIEFLSNSISKPLWSFEDITPRNYKIKSAEQMEVFLALVIHIFSASNVCSSVQGDWSKVALHWATTCSSRHYAGRSFQVFRALKVPLSWPMLSDVLSRLVESVGDTSEDVQGYVMEILLTLEACTDWTVYDSAGDGPRERNVIPYGRDQEDKDLDQYDELANVLSPLGTSDRTPLSSRSGILSNDNQSIRHIRSLSSGCDIRRALGFYTHIGRINHQSNDISRARSASVQCLRANEVSHQTQTDMITRVFWIAVSLFESDYDHEYLMAVELLNQVMTFLNLGRHESRERLEKVLHRLNWTEFPGLQALVLKGLTSAGTSDASLRLLSRLTEFTDVAIVDPSQVSGFGLNILALLSYMAEHFDEPDEFSKTCAANIVQMCCRTSSLANLGKMFKMYADKTYHRPRSTWIEVVCKYIHDSFSRYSKSYVTFLLEVLEYGPQSYQKSVLAILCALIKQIDFSSVTMRYFHNEVLKVISKYLKGNYWKESLEILKIAVSNSSNLDTPPPRPPSTVWSSCDSSWAIDALPVKKELPGRTLEFTYDLSLVPVIGTKHTLEPSMDQTKITPDIPAPRKPNTSQRRTRELLVHVLQTCGHTVGLKQSPSVVFSSSSDLAVEKPTVDHQSSNEDVNNECRKDDQIMGVLTNFDFLDDVSIDSNDESGFVVWPVEESRRYDNLESQSMDRRILQTNSFSGSDLDLTTPHDSSDEDDELNRSMNEGSVSTTCAAVESESAAESAAESMGELEQESTGDHEVIIVVSEETHGSTSTESAVGTSPSGRGEYQIYALTEALNASDDVESLWSDHVSAIVKDTTGVTAVHTYALFWSLYKSIRRKFYSLTRECCNYLDEKFRDVSQHFCNTLEFLVARGDCPYVCLDTETLKKARLFDKQKFMTLELHDHYVNYVTKSNKTAECLDCVKLAIKRSSIGSHNEEPDVYILDKVTHEQRQLDLCRSLYQVHFQFLLLCSTYSRLLDALVKGAQLSKVNDYTHKANSFKADVTSVLEHLQQANEETTIPTNELENLTHDGALQYLTDRILYKDVQQAVYLLRTFREKFGHERFGKSDDDNLDVLLTLFCRQIAEKDVGSLVMSSQATQFACLCNELKDVNVSALAALEELVFP